MLCTVQIASQRSGLSAHLIRMWERRYNALTPNRTDTNRRLYCDGEIERLIFLRLLTENGYRIGKVASLSLEELQKLSATLSAAATPAPASGATINQGTVTGRTDSPSLLETPEQFVQQCVEAAGACDCERMRQLLQRSRQQFGQRGMLHKVICPLICKVGISCQQSGFRPCHEHIATSVIREVLMAPVPGSLTASHAPELIVSTPAGERHELGALLVAASARDLGWRITYLGPNLSNEEIVECARARRVAAVALSVVYPEKCPVMEEKLLNLRGMLPSGIPLIVGGKAAKSYMQRLTDGDIHWAQDLCSLDQILIGIANHV